MRGSIARVCANRFGSASSNTGVAFEVDVIDCIRLLDGRPTAPNGNFVPLYVDV